MSLFEENVDEQKDAKSGGKVEAINKNNSALQDT